MTPRHFCVAGVALGDIHLDFTWQAWHKLTSTVVLAGALGLGLGARDAAAVSRGRRGTNSHLPSFCVAGVALVDIHLRFAWQAWHLATSTFVLSHTIFVTHDFVTHHLSHIIFDTPSWTHHLSHHFVTHHLWHTVTDHFSHTIFHTPLCLTPSLTHHLSQHHLSHTNFVTHHLSHNFVTHQLCHTPSFTHQLCHTPSFTHHLSHTIFHTPSQAIFHTPSFTQHFASHHLSPHHLSHKFVTHQLCYLPSFTHHLSHTVTGHLSHTIFHTTLCLTPSFTTPSFTQICHAPTLSLTIFHTPSFTHRHRPSFTHHPSHTTLSHTIFHTQLCHTQLSHTPSFTHNFVTHTHTPDTIFYVTHQLSHTTLSHTILFYFPTTLCGVLVFWFCIPGSFSSSRSSRLLTQ